MVGPDGIAQLGFSEEGTTSERMRKKYEVPGANTPGGTVRLVAPFAVSSAM